MRIKPPPPPAPKRKSMVTIRFTKPERDQAAAHAKSVGVSMSDYGRLRMLGRGLPRPRVVASVPEVNRELYHELARVGNNLNQIARALNAGETPAFREIRGELAFLRQQVKRLAQAVYGAKGRGDS